MTSGEITQALERICFAKSALLRRGEVTDSVIAASLEAANLQRYLEQHSGVATKEALQVCVDLQSALAQHVQPHAA